MRKFLIGCLCVLLVFLGASYLYYRHGVYIDLHDAPVSTFVKNQGKKLYLETNGQYAEFEIKGVDMGVGIPGHFATDYAVSKQDYLRWFRYIQDMGANTIRVYTLLHDDFYNAFYEYNQNNEQPLYLIHGLWVNDYVLNSHRDAYDPAFLDAMLKDSKTLVDMIHGQRKLSLGRGLGSGTYNKDISPWVLGYILGVEWEDVTVAYTDHLQKSRNSYTGTYMYTTPAATPFEALLAQVGDGIIAYETKRYSQQRLVAFSNWPTTDPFDYCKQVTDHFAKIVKVDVEHIRTTDQFISGSFASYHVYPYYPDFLQYEENFPILTDANGDLNTYYTYLKRLADYHTIPVIISEYGVPTSRGMAQKDLNTGRNQGRMSETDQGAAIAQCYRDIMAAGCAGSMIFTWQDEWFKRTWNTMHAVDLLKTPYWSDYQTNEQYFGLLSFDPGREQSICYVDGEDEDWVDDTPLLAGPDGLTLYAKYDEKFFYLLVRGDAVREERRLYIPFDTTPKSGSTFCEEDSTRYDRPVDFILRLDGRTNTRLVVQERYNVLRAMFSHETRNADAYADPPPVDTPVFNPIRLILQTPSELIGKQQNPDLTHRVNAETYETGLLTYGNANPAAPDFNSLADFCFGADFVEIKLPWQLLNFANPSEMIIHDDYYLHYGVENIKIKQMYLGVATEEAALQGVSLTPMPLKGWGAKPTYHERLKKSYYDVQKMWGGQTAAAPQP